MAPQMLGVEGASTAPPLYTIELHELGQTEWTQQQLDDEGYVALGGFFKPVDEVFCQCVLKLDGSHAMVLIVEFVDSEKLEAHYLTAIDLQLCKTDNLDDKGAESQDVPEAYWLKVCGVIATEHRDDIVQSNRHLALRLYNEIATYLKDKSGALLSDHRHYPPGRRIWEKLGSTLGGPKVQAINYSLLKLLKEEEGRYGFERGEEVSLNGAVDDSLARCIWGIASSFEDVLLIARCA